MTAAPADQRNRAVMILAAAWLIDQIESPRRFAQRGHEEPAYDEPRQGREPGANHASFPVPLRGGGAGRAPRYIDR
jgi:hypothetical protein